jgi:hypothetical protein
MRARCFDHRPGERDPAELAASGRHVQATLRGRCAPEAPRQSPPDASIVTGKGDPSGDIVRRLGRLSDSIWSILSIFGLSHP